MASVSAYVNTCCEIIMHFDGSDAERLTLIEVPMRLIHVPFVETIAVPTTRPYTQALQRSAGHGRRASPR